MNENLEKKSKSKLSTLLKFVLLLASYVLIGFIVWRVATKQPIDPVKVEEQAKKELETLVQSVGKLIILPAEETPQIAVINDVEALKKNQEFFIDAQNEDKILVYAKARKAIIYRQSTNQIVNVALNIGPVTDETNSQPVSSPKTESTSASSTKR